MRKTNIVKHIHTDHTKQQQQTRKMNENMMKKKPQKQQYNQ